MEAANKHLTAVVSSYQTTNVTELTVAHSVIEHYAAQLLQKLDAANNESDLVTADDHVTTPVSPNQTTSGTELTVEHSVIEHYTAQLLQTTDMANDKSDLVTSDDHLMAPVHISDTWSASEKLLQCTSQMFNQTGYEEPAQMFLYESQNTLSMLEALKWSMLTKDICSSNSDNCCLNTHVFLFQYSIFFQVMDAISQLPRLLLLYSCPFFSCSQSLCLC